MMDETFVEKVSTLKEHQYRTYMVDHTKVLVTNPNGDETEFRPAPRPRTCQLESLDAVLTIAKSTDHCPSPEVWVGRKAITVVADRGRREDTYTMPLVHSDQFAAFPFEAPTGRAMRKWKKTFHPLCDLDEFGDKLGQIDVEYTELTSTGTKSSSRKKVVDTLKRVLSGDEELPETIDLRMPVWENDGVLELSVEVVKCLVWVDTSTEAILIQPLADTVVPTINKALRSVMTYIEAGIGRSDVTILRGQPHLTPPMVTASVERSGKVTYGDALDRSS